MKNTPSTEDPYKRDHESTPAALNALIDSLAKNRPDQEAQIRALGAEAIALGLTPIELGKRCVDEIFANSPLPNAEEAPEQTRETHSSGFQFRQMQPTLTRSIGEEFCAAPEYQALIKRGSKTPSRFNIIRSVPTTLPEVMTRATMTSSGLTAIQKVPGVVLLEQQPLTVAALFGQGTTGGKTVQYTKESSFTNAATAVAEGATKPAATLAVEEADAAVKKWAVTVKVTDEAFSDFEYMPGYINSRLPFMVASLIDSELLNGAGGDSVTGILNTSGVQTQSASGSVLPHDAILKAITLVRVNSQMEVDAVIVNPLDWEHFLLTKDNSGQYHAGGPFSTGAYGGGIVSGDSIWRKKVVVTTAISRGTALVGAFRMGASVYWRTGLTVEATNSNEDDFVKNLICIRSEQRGALVPFRPAAFCKVTNIPQPS